MRLAVEHASGPFLADALNDRSSAEHGELPWIAVDFDHGRSIVLVIAKSEATGRA
jgi:hypothetical protein